MAMARAIRGLDFKSIVDGKTKKTLKFCRIVLIKVEILSEKKRHRS